MLPDGNHSEVYTQPIRFPNLLNTDNLLITNPDNNKYKFKLFIVKDHEVDFHATKYVRFHIIKTTLDTKLPVSRDVFALSNVEYLKFGNSENEELDKTIWMNANEIVKEHCSPDLASKELEEIKDNIISKAKEQNLVFVRTANYLKAKTVTNCQDGYFDALKAKSLLELNAVTADVQCPIEHFNKIVSNFLTAEKVTTKCISDQVVILNTRVPNMDLENEIVPIVAYALSKAINVRGRVSTLFDPKELDFFNQSQKEYRTFTQKVYDWIKSWRNFEVNADMNKKNDPMDFQ